MKLNRATFSIISFVVLLLAMTYSSLNLNTTTMILVSLVMFATCLLSSAHLFGTRRTIEFLFLALSIGWFCEYTGEHFGWFFGDYDYTEALGYKFFDVPFVIPIMWFNLCYISLIISSLILFSQPFLKPKNWKDIARLSILTAFFVTAYDLAADPYMIHVVKAWVMIKQDGWWFGGTLVGFVGWFSVAFSIIFLFLSIFRKSSWELPQNFKLMHLLIPVFIYFNWMMFQILYGYPVETRTISVFAMGTPLLILLLSFDKFKNFNSNK